MNQAQALTLRGLGPSGIVQLDFDPVVGLMKFQNARYTTPSMPFSFSLLAASVSTYIWSPDEGTWILGAANESHSVVGGSGAAVQIVVCPGTVAIASGTNQLTAAFDLTVTAPVNRQGTRITTPTPFGRGDSVALSFSGTLTGLVGVASLRFDRVG